MPSEMFLWLACLEFVDQYFAIVIVLFPFSAVILLFMVYSVPYNVFCDGFVLIDIHTHS